MGEARDKIAILIRLPISLIALLTIMCASPGVAAPALCHGLKPGPYAVGFRGEYKLDPSRAFFAERDYDGRATGYWGDRPVRIQMWYPAAGATGRSMVFADYANFPATSRDAAAVEKIIATEDLGSDEGGGIHGVVRGVRGGFERLMHQPMAARRDARPANGRFPLVIYSIGQNDYTEENLVLLEYLASHGYVVVSVPDLGTNPRRTELWIYEPTSFEAQLRDLEFALNSASRERFVNSRKVAAVGHSMGGTYALLLAMRNPSIDAVAGLDASFMAKRESYEFDITSAPYYDPSVLRIPIFEQFRGGDAYEGRIIDSLIYSDRWLTRYDRLTHGDFQSAPFYAATAAPGWGAADELAVRPVSEAVAGFRLIAERLRAFLDATLKTPAPFDADTIPSRGTVSVTRLEPGLKAPNAEDFYWIAMKQGVPEALSIYHRISAANGGVPLFSQSEMMRIINEQVYGDHPDRALDMARIYAAAYPGVASVQSVLARAYERLGRNDEALAVYRKVLQLAPDDTAAAEKIRTLQPGR